MYMYLSSGGVMLIVEGITSAGGWGFREGLCQVKAMPAEMCVCVEV